MKTCQAFTLRSCHGPGHGNHQYFPRSRAFQHPGTFGHRTPRCKDVVHQDNPPSCHPGRSCDGKCPAYIGCSLRRSKVNLGFGPADAAQAGAVEGQVPLPGQNLSEQYGLVEPPLSKAPDMERHRHHQVGGSSSGPRGEGFGGKQPEGPGKLDPPVIFEAVDHVTDRAVEQGGGPGGVEAGGRERTGSAAVIGAANGSEGGSAEVAQGGGDGGDGIPAAGADVKRAGCRDERAAYVAEGWEEDVEKRPQHPPGSEAQVFVYHHYPHVGQPRLPLDDGGDAADPVR